MQKIPKNHIEHMLRISLMIRYCEEALAEGSKNKDFSSPVHLSIGQELISAAMSCFFNTNEVGGDKFFGNHRSHGHYLAVTKDINGLIHEVYGGVEGCSKNLGGSMHITKPELGFEGTVPIVAGTIPLAVGAAIWLKDYTKDALSIAGFGDGAVEEGVFHESLNLASQWKLPIIFLCENNIFSSHMHLSERQPSKLMSRFGISNKIESLTVDGNNANEIYSAFLEAFLYVRKKRRPFFLECNTYRLRAHVGPTRDLEIGLNRNSELPLYEKNDVIKQIKLLAEKEIGEEFIKKTEKDLMLKIQASLKSATTNKRDNFHLEDTRKYLENSHDS